MNMMTNSLKSGIAEYAPEEVSLPIDKITLPKDRQRTIDKPSVLKMEASIENTGLIQPIGVRVNKDGNGIDATVIYGAHRYQAWMNKWMVGRDAWTEGDKEAEAIMGRWKNIPCLVFPANTPDKLVKYYEYEENLVRKNLTKAERETAVGERMKLAQTLFNEGSRDDESSQARGEPWSPPSQEDVCKDAGIGRTAIQKWYRAFRKDNDDVNWNKQSEDNYDSFCEWLISKGEEAEKEKKAKEEKAKEDAFVRVHAELVAAIENSIELYNSSADAEGVARDIEQELMMSSE